MWYNAAVVFAHKDGVLLDHPPQPTLYWRCLNCGQVYFGDMPPDICPFCMDITTWVDHSLDQQSALDDGGNGASPGQLSLFRDQHDP